MKIFLQPIYALLRQWIAHPKYRWWVIAGTLIYLLDPFDLSPDMIPLLGQLDDGLLITLVAAEVVQVMTEKAKSKKTGDVSPVEVS